MLENLARILRLFDRSERRQAYWLLGTVVGMALMETLGVASIAPFMAIVANPSLIHSNVWLARVYGATGSLGDHRFLFFVGLAVLLMLALSNAISAATTFYMYRFAYMREHTISTRLLEQYLGRPYAFFLRRNTAELSKNMLSEVFRFVLGVLVPMANVIARAIVALFLIGLLLWINPMLATIVALSLGGAYGVIYFVIRRRLGRIGIEQSELSAQRYKVANEALTGIKDIKVLGREQAFLSRYARYSQAYSRRLAASQTVAQVPRYALETVAFGGIVLIVLYLLGTKHDLSQALPLMALYAFAGYRLMPALQQIFNGLSLIKFNLAALTAIEADLQTIAGDWRLGQQGADPTSLACARTIEMRHVSFAYAEGGRSAVKRMNLVIHANTTVGLVGTTGSGKTTVADLLLGLLTPSEGEIQIDGVALDEANIRQWQNGIGYIPQHIFLSDDSVAANIAFGVPPDEIDHQAVERAARMANLHDFIATDLAQGYATEIGERGVRLSGGQRQRIGIARALYHDPKVLVMDEATSAMDNSTERAVMEAIHGLGSSKTIIMIAHRLTTVQRCDRIFLFNEGRLVASGRYDELLDSSAAFRRLAGSTGR